MESAFTLQLETFEDFNCYNYVLKTNSKRKGNQLVVEIEGTYFPENVCLDTFGPAVSNIEIDSEVDQLQIKHGDYTDIYELDFSDNKIKIIPRSVNFTIPRIFFPEDLTSDILACDCGTDVEPWDLCDQIFKILEDSTELVLIQEDTINYLLPSTVGFEVNSKTHFYTNTSEQKIKAYTTLVNYLYFKIYEQGYEQGQKRIRLLMSDNYQYILE